MQLGLTMVGCIAFCLWIGRMLDKWIGTRGIFTTVFILLGIVGGAVTAYRQIDDVMKPKKDPDEKSDDEPMDDN
jgi:F0F1-type ATP synthase assembly protein I